MTETGMAIWQMMLTKLFSVTKYKSSRLRQESGSLRLIGQILTGAISSLWCTVHARCDWVVYWEHVTCNTLPPASPSWNRRQFKWLPNVSANE